MSEHLLETSLFRERQAIGVPVFSVVVLNWNGGKRVLDCLKSILLSEGTTFEVIFVDNASTDGSFEQAQLLNAGDSRVRFVRNSQNLQYCGGMNAGIKHASGEYVFFLCDDTELDSHCLLALEQEFRSHTVGALIPVAYSQSDRGVIASAGQIIDRWGFSQGYVLEEADTKQCSGTKAVASACGLGYAVPRVILEFVGGLDEDFVAYYEDVDLCRRIRLLGYRVVYSPNAVLFHHQNHERAKDPITGDFKLFHLRKNRITVILKNYAVSSLLLYFLPALTLELGIAFWFAIVERRIKNLRITFRALAWISFHLNEIRRKRRQIQSTRRVPETEILADLSPHSIVISELRLLFQAKLDTRG